MADPVRPRYRGAEWPLSPVTATSGYGIPDNSDPLRGGADPTAFGFRNPDTPYPDDTRRALTAMCNAVARWYEPGGPVTIPELISRYRRLARTLLGCATGADRPADDG